MQRMCAERALLSLQEQNRPDINIVCEKIAFQGLTRFENRQALPLGVSTNFTAYSAKLLTQARPLSALRTAPASADSVSNTARLYIPHSTLCQAADLVLLQSSADAQAVSKGGCLW